MRRDRPAPLAETLGETTQRAGLHRGSGGTSGSDRIYRAEHLGGAASACIAVRKNAHHRPPPVAGAVLHLKRRMAPTCIEPHRDVAVAVHEERVSAATFRVGEP